ncbi:MAG: hypothetical protein PF904_03450 [Kiritimatiellae bacterium]|jgi:hypothetical protein|nr:hypothetical protein [Kiritimatiellia bacterium]
MNKNTNNFRRQGERGSALLIVLGFLSFMIISAVAFAIYMRIERQASSNYRHASSARHLLNSALYRAMDEIDSELRADIMPLIGNSNSSDKNNRKFPTWPGRVRTSAVVNSLDNGGNARVLSLDALSYIPGILLNDVRYYSVMPYKYDPGIENYTQGHEYLGAKWRPFSRPLLNMEGQNAAGSAVVGRYAYVCVNISDMLNVNTCRAVVRDATENQISIGHLFKNDADRLAFEVRRALDKGYTTLHDFYSCMFEMNKPAIFNSPWHDYLDTSLDWKPFNDATKHVLVTDGIVKAEPVTNPNPYNILTAPPIAAADLINLQPPVEVSFQDAAFGTALNNALNGNIGSSSGFSSILPTLLCDYIDVDNVPSALNMPSVELAPMISQISVPPTAAFIASRQQTPAPAPPATPVTIYTLDLTSLGNSFVDVELMWPFKYTSYRTTTDNYVIEVKAYLKVDKSVAENMSDDFATPPLKGNGYIAELTGSVPAPNFWSRNISNPNDAFAVVNVPLTANFNAANNGPGTPGGTPNLDLCDSDGTTYNGFAMGSPFTLSLVLGYVRIKNDSNGKYVDNVPTMLPFPGYSGITEWQEYTACEKLFFQTGPSLPLATTMAVGPVNQIPAPVATLRYAWTCLETADPRFNWKTHNWIQSNVAAADGALNQSTLDVLDPSIPANDGRDGDIFMSVSNVGRLQSPGELGAILRPFNYQVSGNPVDFRTHNDVRFCQDYNAMFRTIRLYDQGDPTDLINCRHDDIYNNFIAANADGSLTGARVNPLSDISMVLGAAVERIPLDFWISNEITTAVQADNTPSASLLSANYSTLMAGNDWRNFTNGWSLCLNNVSKVTDINTTYSSHLKDEYGSHEYFGWYSGLNPNMVFQTAGASPFDATSVAPSLPLSLTAPLHEVDREMLYAFTLDSFSDRQQLFLYIISAEATAASFGDETSSLAGGKAVALVWRDPYPVGFDAGSVVLPAKMYPDNSRISPWEQDYLGVDDDGNEYYDKDTHSLNREQGYHEQKILFFKYLDN